MKGIKGKVVAIASSKGGVGKTIFATNLAGVYHYLGKKGIYHEPRAKITTAIYQQ